METHMLVVYTTCKNIDEAKKIASHLLDKRLIACANMIPSTSMYNWEGKRCVEDEVTLFMKTKKLRAYDVKEEIKKIHSYDVPCILMIPSDSSVEFKDWVFSQVP